MSSQIDNRLLAFDMRWGGLQVDECELEIEVDGERLRGVVSVIIESNAEGKPTIMLFTDRTLSDHVSCGGGVVLAHASLFTDQA